MNTSKKLMVLVTFVVMCLALCIGAYAANVARVGSNGQEYTSLQAAIDAAADGDYIDILADFTISEVGAVETSTGAKSFGAIINKSLYIAGNSHTITGGNSSFRAVLGIKGGDMGTTVLPEDDQIQVYIFGLTIDAGACNMALEDRGNVKNLQLYDCNLYAGNKKAYTQPLTIGGIEGEINVFINNCKIWTDEDASRYYAIMIWAPVDMTIVNSDIRGWACLYFKDGSAGASVEASNTNFKSVGIAGNTNDFGMITAEDDNVQVLFNECRIDVTAAANTTQALLTPSNGNVDDPATVTVALAEGTTVSFTGDSAVVADGSPASAVTIADDTAFQFTDADAAVEDVNFYLPEGKVVEVAANGAGTVTDAPQTSNGKTLLVYNLDKVDGQARIAVFAGIDSLDYERVGFEITQNGVTKVYTTRWVSTAVSVTSNVPGVSHVYEAAEFENGAQYVFGMFINVEDDTPVTVRAFAITNAGTQVANEAAPAVEDAYTLMTIIGGGADPVNPPLDPPPFPIDD